MTEEEWLTRQGHKSTDRRAARSKSSASARGSENETRCKSYRKSQETEGYDPGNPS